MTVASDPQPHRAKRPSRLFRNLMAKIASIPMILTALVVFVGGTAWTVVYSFTGSRMLPKTKWVGFDQYERLYRTLRFTGSVR
jgi:glucose/mannose transport system permease protein